MKMIGIIFSNIFDTSLGVLTQQRTLASLPFGGRYRLVDFNLSNMANSGLSTIGVIIHEHYQSLLDHMGSCDEWDLNRKNEHVMILPPANTNNNLRWRGKLDALYDALTFIKRAKGDYVLLSDSNVLCNIDYDRVLKEHIASGCDITVVANREVPTAAGQKADLVLQVNEEHNVTDIALKHTFDEGLCGMGMYLIAKDLLIAAIEESVAHSLYDFERDFLQQKFLAGQLTVHAHKFKNSVLRNNDIPSYFENNMKLLNRSIRNDIFNPGNPIYTKVRDEAPSYYQESAKVVDCLIADGCQIEGTVENSILFRDVVIEEGCHIKNSIIMQGTKVKKGAHLEYAILDKDVEISEGRTLIGAKNAPIIIEKNGKI